MRRHAGKVTSSRGTSTVGNKPYVPRIFSFFISISIKASNKGNLSMKIRFVGQQILHLRFISHECLRVQQYSLALYTLLQTVKNCWNNFQCPVKYGNRAKLIWKFKNRSGVSLINSIFDKCICRCFISNSNSN